MPSILESILKSKPGRKSGMEEVLITRIFNAPRDQVWKTWTDPDRLKLWWGPKAFTAPSIRIDLRAGGSYLYCMRSPDGDDYWSTGVFREIIPFKKIVVTDSFADANGNVVPASAYGLDPGYPLELLVTVTFEEQKGKTRLILLHEGFPSVKERNSARAGWEESLDKLAKALKENSEEFDMTKTSLADPPCKPEIVIKRIFDAPRDLVFKVITDPDLIPRWWGPSRLETKVDRMELRPGGIWRFVQRDAAGKEYAFHGVFHAMDRPERLVYTFEFEGMPGHVLLETMTLEERGGRTKITDTSVFQTVEDRDGMLESGMQEGATETMDRLASLLLTIRKAA